MKHVVGVTLTSSFSKINIFIFSTAEKLEEMETLVLSSKNFEEEFIRL